MWHLYRSWRRRRILSRADTSEAAWQSAWSRLPLLRGLSAGEAQRLRELAILFLAEKRLIPIGGLEIRPQMAQELALQAALPLLGLDMDWYLGWTSVLLYPDSFVREFETRDAAGVVHRMREARSGESWDRGPLILSWADVEAGRATDGYNVVIHELAHKLDGLNGATNGMPPLHPDMPVPPWSRALGEAFAQLRAELDSGYRKTALDPYAAESPAELFAVVSESFFEIPGLLLDSYPEVYRQLSLFYRQDPFARLGRPGQGANAPVRHSQT